MASSDGFTHFLLSMGSLENNADSKFNSDTLFKILDFCQVLQKKHQFLEGVVNELRSENGTLRAQVDKLRADLAQRVEAIVDRKTQALQARLNDAEKKIEESQQTAEQFVTLEEVSTLAESREKDFQSRIDTRVSSELSKLAPKENLEQTQADVTELGDRFDRVADRLQDWKEYRRLQEENEIGEVFRVARTPLGNIHLLHPSKSSPLRWELKNFSNFKRLARGNTCRRLYSRPFGIEKDGTVRCVLRVLIVMLPNEDVFQFALEVLYATKYKRKFDFRFQILSPTQGKSMVKTFSSTEACIPRYWFPQNELQPSGLVSFAFAVTEEQLIKGDLLIDDKLLIQVGLRE